MGRFLVLSWSLLLAGILVPGASRAAESAAVFGRGWERFSSTPGRLSVRPGALSLEDGAGPPDYVTAAKDMRVNLDRTPLFVVEVQALSDRGEVKLIRRRPFEKRRVFAIDSPGVYVLDVRRRLGWRGAQDVQVCLYAVGDRARITYAYAGFAAKLTPRWKALLRRRAAAGNPRLHVAPFELDPTFTSCSVYFKSGRRPGGVTIEYRRAGGGWRRAFPPVYAAADGMYRGSIVNLREDTAYEVRVAGRAGTVLARGRFHTWCSRIPVAKTVVLDPAHFQGHYSVKDSGRADGWLRITAPNGSILRNDRGDGPLLELRGVRYILLERLTLRGGGRQAVAIDRCDHVRVVNCDIAGWGRQGKQRFDRGGKFYSRRGAEVNWDPAILIRRSRATVIERCYIHDPRGRANSWYYSHPAGPEALGIDRPVATVVRYNDFIGSDRHRWNDAVEGAGNFHVDGGFNRDADIYGNLMCFANDDAIEIDGGQTNVRVFLNKFEGCLCGVSIQGCLSGPSYVFRNLIVNLGDERGLAGQTIKTSSYKNGPDATAFVFNNTCWGRSSDLHLVSNLAIVAENNIFAGMRAISGRGRMPGTFCDYNLLAAGGSGAEKHGVAGTPRFVAPLDGIFRLRPDSPARGRGVALAGFTPETAGRIDLGAFPTADSPELPFRPIPVVPDRGQIVFSPDDLRAGRAKNLGVTVVGSGYSRAFYVAKNAAFDWFTVSPARGRLESGRRVVFTVRLRPSRMLRRPLCRGAFLIRQEDGYSRPILVYAVTGEMLPIKPAARRGAGVVYAEAEKAAAGRGGATGTDPSVSAGGFLRFSPRTIRRPVMVRFRIPESGRYFLVLRVRSPSGRAGRGTVSFGIDGAPLERSRIRLGRGWGWTLAAHNRKMSLICLESFQLRAGDHEVRLLPHDSFDLDVLAFTTDPKPFEPLFVPPPPWKDGTGP